jgi:hypothetical protein
LKESVRTESSSLLPLLLTDTSRFPLLISDVAVVRANIGFNILITIKSTTAATTIFKKAKIVCRNIEFCEVFPTYFPNFVTNAFDESTKDNALVSNVVFISLSVVAVAVASELIC